jgi:hypothetical protein
MGCKQTGNLNASGVCRWTKEKDDNWFVVAKCNEPTKVDHGYVNNGMTLEMRLVENFKGSKFVSFTISSLRWWLELSKFEKIAVFLARSLVEKTADIKFSIW